MDRNFLDLMCMGPLKSGRRNLVLRLFLDNDREHHPVLHRFKYLKRWDDSCLNLDGKMVSQAHTSLPLVSRRPGSLVFAL
jgi:hypothetical protein